MKQVVILLIMIQSSTALGYNSQLNTSNLFKRGPKPKNLSLEFVLASEQTKDQEKEVDGLYTKMDTSLLYALSYKDHLRFFVSHLYVTNEIEDDSFTTDLAEIMYRRNILNQNENGIDLDLELKNYYLIDGEKRELYGYNGAFIPQVILNKGFGRGFNTELKLRRQFMHRNNPNDSTLSTIDRVYFTPSYYFLRKFVFATQFKYEHKIKKADSFSYRYNRVVKKDQEIMIFHPSLLYFYNYQTVFEFYVETKLSDSSDNRSTKEIAQQEQVLGMAMYLTAF